MNFDRYVYKRAEWFQDLIQKENYKNRNIMTEVMNLIEDHFCGSSESQQKIQTVDQGIGALRRNGYLLNQLNLDIPKVQFCLNEDMITHNGQLDEVDEWGDDEGDDEDDGDELLVEVVPIETKVVIKNPQIPLHAVKLNNTVDVYEGERDADNKRSGMGKLITKTGHIYEGQFKNDLPNGVGKLITCSGEVYEGEFKQGACHGQGKLTLKNGRTFQGEF